MVERLLLVDLENVQKLDLSKIPSEIRVMVFYGVPVLHTGECPSPA